MTPVYQDALKSAGDFLIRIGAASTFVSLVWLIWDSNSSLPGYLMVVAVVSLALGYLIQ